MAEHIYTYINPCSERHLAKVLHVLENDGIIAYPTDVNWAFGCDSRSRKAFSRLRSLKPGHPKEQPFSLICHSFSMISHVAILSQPSYRLLKKILPGPYTIILKRSKDLPKQIHDKRLLVGVRMPVSALLSEIVRRLGRPLLSSSLPQTSLDAGAFLEFGYEVEECFGHALDLVLDLGEQVPHMETTVLDLSDGVEIIREGAGSTKMFEDFL